MKKIISVMALIFVITVLLTCAVSAKHITENFQENITEDYYVYTVKELINYIAGSGDLSYSYTYDYDNIGNDTATFTVSDDGHFDGAFYATLSPIDQIKAYDYPFMVMGYTNNIVYDQAYADANKNGNTMPDPYAWAVSYYLNKNDGKEVRFWGPRGEMTADGGSYKTILNIEDIEKGDNNAIPEDINRETKYGAIRFLPFSDSKKDVNPKNWNETNPYLEVGTSFTIEYIAFFQNEEDATNFTFKKDDYIVPPEAEHPALMAPADGASFKPDAQLSRADAATAVAIGSGYNSENDYYSSQFKDVASTSELFDILGYLIENEVITNAETFDPKDPITQDELKTWIEKTKYTYPESVTAGANITRGDAARVFSKAFGRTPKENMYKDTIIGIFKDVSVENENFLYIMEVAHEHKLAYDETGKENWLSAKDSYFYMTKTDDTYILQLEDDFEQRRENILNSVSEWETNSYYQTNYQTNGKSGTVYYISNSGSDSNTGTSSDKPLATYSVALYNKLKSGDVVLFERGGKWGIGTTVNYGSENNKQFYKFRFKSGVTYSAYGTGEKPKLYGSIYAGNTGDWERVGTTNVWRYKTKTFTLSEDVGNIVLTPKADSGITVNPTSSEYESYRPEEAKKLYGQRILINPIAHTVLSTGLDKLVGNGKETWILDHERGDYKLDLTYDETTLESNAGEQLSALVDKIKEDNPNKNPDLIYFHAWRDTDQSIFKDKAVVTKKENNKTIQVYEDGTEVKLDGYINGDNYLYLYCANGNPGEYYDIEICTKGNVITPTGNNITIDNLAILYGASHGIGAGTGTTNLIVRNCEVGWIGGAVQGVEPVLDSSKKIKEWDLTRFGNSVEIFGTTDGYDITDCYMYQAFDCGPTVQWQGTLGDTTTKTQVVEKNILFSGNALWDADLEVWLTSRKVDNTAFSEEEADADSSKYFAALINCVTEDNYVTGSGYGFGGYNHQKAEYCAFYGGDPTKALYEDCYMQNNYFWDLRYHLLKASPTSTAYGKGFHWKDNTIIQRYNDVDHEAWFGRFGSNLINCTGYVPYKYDHKTLKRFYTLNTLDANNFMYTLAEGQTDPALAYAKAPEEVIGMPARLVAIVDTTQLNSGTISAGSTSSNPYKYDEYVSDRVPTELTAVPNDENAAAYWTRITQTDRTRVFLDGINDSTETIQAYPLGSGIFYQPIFISGETTLRVNYYTHITMDDVNGYVKYDESVYDYGNGSKLTVEYYKPSTDDPTDVQVQFLESKGKTVSLKYTESCILRGDGPKTKWVAYIGDNADEFTLSYNTDFRFSYMFKAGTAVRLEEKSISSKDNTKVPLLNNIAAWWDEANGFTNFTASFELPAGYERLSHGVLMAQEESLLRKVSDENEELLVPEGVIIGRISNNNDPSPVYMVSKRLGETSADEWFGRAYITYSYNGRTYTYFSNSIISTAGKVSFVTVTESGVLGDYEAFSPSINVDNIEIVY